MFTVVIGSRGLLYDCHNTYNAFLAPLIENDEVVFCQWFPEGESLAEAVPDLEKSIAKHRDWRAIIVTDSDIVGYDNVATRNPFDYARSITLPTHIETEDEANDFLERKEAALRRAVSNPLTKLSSWLFGAAMRSEPDVCDEDCTAKAIDEYYKKCYEIMHEHFDDVPQIFNSPKRVIAVAERNIDRDEFLGVNSHHEFEYSRFYEDNMYPNQLRYIAYDVGYIKGRRDADTYFNFLVFILTLAGSECPHDALKPNRVYCAEAILDDRKITELCHKYIFKLIETKGRIGLYSQKLDDQKEKTLDNDTFERVFESDVIVPVKINSDFAMDSMNVEHSEIGLVSDYPGDDREYWDSQYNAVSKRFSRYLREPRRAVKVAVKGDFRELDSIDDDRVLRLNEFQRENIKFRLDEEEEKMVRSSNVQMFETKKLKERMEETGDKVSKAIAQRLNRKKAVALGVVTTVLFLLGFMQVIISGALSEESVVPVLVIALVAMGLFIIVILLKLLADRFGIVKLIKNFNFTVQSICRNAESSLATVSEYLSHACNVMREFSVLNAVDNDSQKKRTALAKHRADIDKKIDETYELFFKYIDEKLIEENSRPLGKCKAYEYDFTVMRQYEYNMPYSEEKTHIEFMQPGYIVEVPVDYLSNVVLRREELYD